MNVDIKATTIQQIMNADVINIDQIRGLSADAKSDIINQLIASLEKQSESLMNKPNEIPSANILKLAENTNKVMKDISENPKDMESNKNQISEILKDMKNFLGSTSDILFNAIKIAQVLGIT